MEESSVPQELDYEKLREANIQRNAEFLSQLGIGIIKEQLGTEEADRDNKSWSSDISDLSSAEEEESEGGSSNEYILLSECDSNGNPEYWKRVGRIFVEDGNEHWRVQGVAYNDAYVDEEEEVDGYFFEYVRCPAVGDPSPEYSPCTEILNDPTIRWVEN